MFIQYQNAPKFNKLLTLLESYLTIPIDEFYDHYFNIDTADTQGLDNWGLILNQSRTVYQYSLKGVFGFGVKDFIPSGAEYPQPFGHGVFYSDYISESNKVTLSNPQYREMLKLIYQTYVTDCSLQSCEQIVNNYIQSAHNNPTYKCRIIEGNMSFTYSFNFKLWGWELSLFKLTGILPKPAGISYDVIWGQE